MESLWQILSGAPWWVYLLFIYILIIGIRSIKPRTTSINKIVLFPLFFVALSVYTLYKNVYLGYPLLIPCWIIFLSLGTYLGFKEVQSWHFEKNRLKRTLTIPGNYSTLILLLLVFILKFFWGYFYATLFNIPHWMYFADTITSSIVTGFFVGRASCFFNSYQEK